MQPHPLPTTTLTLAHINREAYIYFGAGVTVAWQMARSGVGRGVARHSHTLRDPLGRLRATMAYVYAVTLGTAEDRAAIARHVNRAHGPVRGEGYNAFDPDLQLWVAATLYRGALDVHALFAGPVPAASREAIYSQARAFGNTLQVDDAQWPADAQAFDVWWARQEAGLQVDDEVRAYMQAVLRGGRAPWYLRPALPLQAFATRGLMTPGLRTLFDLPWTARDQRNWEHFVRWAPRLYWVMPSALRHWPAKYFLARWRTHHRHAEASAP